MRLDVERVMKNADYLLVSLRSVAPRGFEPTLAVRFILCRSRHPDK